MTYPRITSFISSKGGSGKTVTSASLATFLSEIGFSVLLVDTDASTNGMTLLFLEQLLGHKRQDQANASSKRGLFERSDELSPTAIQITPNLSFLPATYSLSNTENCSSDSFERALNHVIGRSTDDFIFLDAQAGADNFAAMSAKASVLRIIVSEYDPVSAQGIERLKIIFADILDPSSTYILFNKILPEFATAIGEGLSIANYLPPITWDADVLRAFARRDLALDMERPNTYTLAIAQVAEALFFEETATAIQSWRQRTFEGVAEPLARRLDEIQYRLYLSRSDTKRKMRTRILSSIGLLLLGGLSLYLNNKPTLFGLLSNSLEMGSSAHFALTVIAVFSLISAFALIITQEITSGSGTRYNLDLLDESNKVQSTIAAAKAVHRIGKDTGIYQKRRQKYVSDVSINKR